MFVFRIRPAWIIFGCIIHEYLWVSLIYISFLKMCCCMLFFWKWSAGITGKNVVSLCGCGFSSQADRHPVQPACDVFPAPFSWLWLHLTNQLKLCFHPFHRFLLKIVRSNCMIGGFLGMDFCSIFFSFFNVFKETRLQPFFKKQWISNIFAIWFEQDGYCNRFPARYAVWFHSRAAGWSPESSFPEQRSEVSLSIPSWRCWSYVWKTLGLEMPCCLFFCLVLIFVFFSFQCKKWSLGDIELKNSKKMEGGKIDGVCQRENFPHLRCDLEPK